MVRSKGRAIVHRRMPNCMPVNRKAQIERMTIHYLNGENVERFITNVIHLQNIDNDTWSATFENGKEITLLAFRIEGVYAENREDEKTTR